MMKRILMFTLVIALLSPLSLAFGERRMMGGPRHPGGMDMALWEDLSDQQKDQILHLKRKLLEETTPLLGSFIAKHLEVKALWADPAATPATLEAKMKETLDLDRQIQEKAFKYRIQARSFLTTDQILKFQGGFWLLPDPGRGGRSAWGMGPRGRGGSRGGDDPDEGPLERKD